MSFKKVHFKWPLEEKGENANFNVPSSKITGQVTGQSTSDESKRVLASRISEIPFHRRLPKLRASKSVQNENVCMNLQEPGKTGLPKKNPVVINTKVIVRPRTVKNRSKNDDKTSGFDSPPQNSNFLPMFGTADNAKVNCYGSPKTASKTPRSAKKSATEPIFHDFVLPNRKAMEAVSGVEYTQITARIIALTFPTNGSDAVYRHSIKEISDKLKRTYHDKYRIFNVSQKRSDLGRANAGAVQELGWPAQLAPPLDRLCSICKQIENWLNLNPENRVVIHCKGYLSRVAIVVASYMHYLGINGEEKESVADRFSMQIFSEKYLGVDGQPSHRRYVRYFANLLSGKTRVNPTPIFLTNVSFTKLSGKGIVLKIYERMKPIYSSQPISIKANARIEIDGGLSLRGDVLVKCFEKRSSSDRNLVFQCQFNTCALDLDPRNPVVHFYKEELDLVTTERHIDTQTAIEFAFLFEPPKEKKKSSKRSLSLSSARESKERDPSVSRADSYENFDRPEDDRSLSSLADPPLPSVYTEIHRSPSTPTQPSPLDGADSGIGSDSPKQTMAPQVPPKPKRPISVPVGDIDPDDPLRSAYEDSTIGRDRSVLPASVRPSSRPNSRQSKERPVSPTESNTTVRSGIEPDLAPKDRYDPNSKCFSYVPAKALKEHYIAPKKPSPSLRRPSVERSNLDVANVDRESIKSVPIQSSELPRRAETPTWDSVVDKIAPKVELPEVRRNYKEVERERYRDNDYFSKTLPNGFQPKFEDEYERPVIVNQAKRAAPTRRRYGSYTGINDDYNSDMDDLCDPDFYLSYASGGKKQDLPKSTPSRGVSQRELDEIDSIIDSSATLPPRSCFTPKPQSAAERDAFRYRNCRSVTSAPAVRKLFSNERYDATTDAENPDDWLKNKLKSLHQKRGRYPEALARKNTERILLEELKNAHDEKEAQKNEYISEGMGKRIPVADPLEEYQKEEERLRNTRSPFAAIDDFRTANRAGTPSSKSNRGSIIRGKPPTPPPKERSRSPLRSPLSNRRTPSAYQQERHRIAATDYLSDDEDDDADFSHLSKLVPEHRQNGTATKSILKRPGRSLNNTPTSGYADSTFDGSERRDIYASPLPIHKRIGAPEDPRYSTLGESAASTPVPFGRAETPGFPVSRDTPLPFHPLLYQGASADNGTATSAGAFNNAVTHRSGSPRSMYFGQSRRSSLTSNDGGDVIHHHPVFVKDTSKYWYKPNISREDAINMLRDKPPGTFVVRDSNSFPGAFGLALKVSKPPEGVPLGDGTELVRHFLIEPSPKGVKLKGCNNEPVFGTLAALVYQHSITPMALPCRLILPEYDPASTPEHLNAAQALLEQGAACNCSYIYSCDTESLTGPEAVRKTVREAMEQFSRGAIRAVSIHFKVSASGITLTDNTRSLFFRRHYPVSSVIYAGIDPEDRKWDNNTVAALPPTYVRQARIFGFVARKINSPADNACHIFAELEPEQPSSAVVNFITKVMMGQQHRNRTLPQ